jgi:DNA mismatch repair protein MutS2
MKQPIIIAHILAAATIGPDAIAFQLQHPAASFLCDRSSRTELLSSSPSIDTETNNDGSNSSGGRSIYDDMDSFQRDSRAGEDGYSVLRRPVTFDADVDPIFDAPLVLDEKEEEQLMDANKNWYEERSGEGRMSGNGRKKSQNSKNNVLGEYADVLQVSNDDKNNNNNNLHTTRQNEEDQHLDMFQRTLETLDYPLVLRALANECETMKGKEIVMSSHSHGGKGVVDNSNNDDDDIATMPLTASSVTGVHQRFGAVQEMQRLMEGRVSGWVTSSREQQQGKKKAVRKPLGAPPIGGHTFDLQPIFDIVDEGKVLEGPEILDIQTMLEVSLDVLDWTRALKEFNNDLEADNVDLQLEDPFIELPRLTQSISIDDELYHLLTNAFDDDGKLSGTTFPGIGRLRAKVRTYKRDILSSIESILSLPSMKNKLAVESGGSLTMEINGRLVIPVQQSYSNSVGIVHDASRSGKTAYVEPSEIVGPTNELRQAEAELRSEEARVWRQLTEMVVKDREEIERNVASIGQLDLTMARVRLGKRLSGVVPTVAEDGVVSVKEARHPILLLRGLEGVVGSDIDIGEGNNQGLILTGPNSGGKTIVLKLLGLFAFMVRDGIPVPCEPSEPARVDFFSPVLADIGDIQSVDSDLSTFSGHMLVVREVLNNADKNALVLMDEPGSGTDPNQGVAIAQALLEALLDRGCRVAITTHYLELKQLASTDDRFAVAGMQFKNGKPTYKLLPGVIGESFALAVAERLKLPQAVIDRAYNLLDSETRQMGELIRDLEDQKKMVEEKAEEMRKRDFEMRELKADMKRQQERLEAKQLNARREEAKKFSAKLEEKEKLLEDILEKLKGSGASKKVIADSWSDIRIVKREALAEAENVSGGVMNRLRQQQSEAEEIDLIPISEMSGINKVNVDDEVVVCKKGAFYGKSGTVKQVGKKIIQVAVGGVPVRLTLKEIAFPPSSGYTAKARTNNNPTMSKMAQRALELDSSADSPIDMSPNASPRDKGSTMKTKANTVDCVGKNFEESKRLALYAFSNAAMSNRSVVYILHGHGTGVLKKKIREWLKSDRQWVKNFRPADQEDGGDALTRVELKKQDLF